jgi:hypothetical protein
MTERIVVCVLAIASQTACFETCLSCQCDEEQGCLEGERRDMPDRVSARRAGVVLCAMIFCATASACFSPCLSCACESNEECPFGTTCADGVCVSACEINDVAPDECDEQCNDDDDCDALFVCDLDAGACVRDACAADADCELEEAPRCDLDAGMCVAAEQT